MNRFIGGFLVIGIAMVLISCGWRTIKGNGNITTSMREEGSFQGVKTAGSFDLYVTQDDTYKIRIEAEENLMKYILTENDGGVLKIKIRKGVNLRPKKDMKIFVTAPVFRELVIAGSGNIKTETKLSSAESVSFSIAGSGDIRVSEIEAPRVKVNIAGSGNVLMAGQTREADYNIAGGGDIKCGDLKSENATVEIAGSGNVWLFASQNLEVKIAGGGDIHYRGNPVHVKKKVAGSGNLIKED